MIWKRIKNLWKLSSFEIPSYMDVDTQRVFNKMFKKEQVYSDTPKMAQIIKMKSDEEIIKELLNEK